VGLVFSTAVHASDVANSEEQSNQPANTLETSSTTGTAQDWGLNDQEWERYKQFMQGANGKWYPQLTPAAILGLNAQTPEEQKHFAEIVARQEHDKVAREINFNNAVFTAMRRLYANEPIIKDFDKSAFNPRKSSLLNTSSASHGNQ